MSWTDHYSTLDRIVHRAAFAGIGLQKIVADLEDTVFASRFAAISCDRPIFITSLPRAGTTLLLEILSQLPATATHTYRNMPFLLCPLIWDQFSRAFRRDGGRRERAHGDGVAIDYDSAEAFEEALWQAWWPSKYHNGRIALWSATDEDQEFELFFVNHLRKVVALSQRNKSPQAGRYVSKNNANIARLPLLGRLFPDATIVVPVREPRAHVRSLHRQHLRFLTIHSEDAFARTYMRAIGHLDFGANFAPIDFPGADGDSRTARNASFWLDYWIAAYGMLAASDIPQVVFVSYEALRACPTKTLHGLLRRLGESAGPDLNRLSALVRRERQEIPPGDGLDAARLAEADTIHDRLMHKSEAQRSA